MKKAHNTMHSRLLDLFINGSKYHLTNNAAPAWRRTNSLRLSNDQTENNVDLEENWRSAWLEILRKISKKWEYRPSLGNLYYNERNGEIVSLCPDKG